MNRFVLCGFFIVNLTIIQDKKCELLCKHWTNLRLLTAPRYWIVCIV